MKYQLILISLCLRSSLQMIKSGPSKISCPNSCECFIAEPGFLNSGGLAVSCKPDKKSSIPEVDQTVTYLNLSGWNITTLDADTFRKTKNIEISIDRRLRIRFDNGTLSDMKELISLKLYGNSKTKTVGAFSNLRSKLMTVDLGHNPWHCGCSLWNNLKGMREVMSMNWFGVVCKVEEFNRFRSPFNQVTISLEWSCPGLSSESLLLFFKWVLWILTLLGWLLPLSCFLKLCHEHFRDSPCGCKMALRSPTPQTFCGRFFGAKENFCRHVSRCCDSNWGVVGLRIRRLIDRLRTKEDSHQNVGDPSNQSKFASGSEPDFKTMLYGIGRVIGQVRARGDPKSLKKIFCNQIILSEHCAKDDPSYHYFKFMQLLRKEHSDEELKKFADQLYEEIDNEDFKEIIGVLVLKFWGLVYGIVKDKSHSLSESAPETNGVVAKSEDDINSSRNFSTDPKQAAEYEKKEQARFCCGLVAVTQSGEFEKLTLLNQLMAALHEAFNPSGCLPEYQKACCSCLPFYFIQKIVAVFFGRCFKNSKKCRNCYRKTKPLHRLCCYIGLCLYAIVIALLALGFGSFTLRLFLS